jgi:septum formation protein
VIVLASGSPRRRELLTHLHVPFRVVVPDVDESARPGESPRALVRRLATEKAAAVAAALDNEAPHTTVLAADTVVEVDGEILGKPLDADDARRMLRRLSGRSHHVHTGVALRRGEHQAADTVTTVVTFVALSAPMIEWYLATGEPFDKAGAYAIQGTGGVFVEAVRGSVSNVVGLPLTTVARMLQAAGAWSPSVPPAVP